jgi:hypothetical protein
MFAFAAIAALITIGAVPSPMPSAKIHPPQALVTVLGQLSEIATLAGLPEPVRNGTFVVPGGGKAAGWKLAAPGGAWNATDAIVDPSLPGRRMIFAACDADACVLHYERGGIAHMYYVMTLARDARGWKLTWLGVGHPEFANYTALKAALVRGAAPYYFDDPEPSRDF